ncbi:MAG: response regulator transcription factor [Lachnospiraceae bacterium]|nr:response regulator transcription factor [Lachnospiraceae bacterium]
MTKILLVEDDEAIVKSLTEFLKMEGFAVTNAKGQSDALRLAGETEFDLVLLDISLRDGNGFVVCSALKQDRDIPVIFLTASGDEHSVVAGLEMGADDYIAKPFRPRELVSRIRTVLRRTGKGKQVLEIGGVYLDAEKGAAFKNGADLCLSALEYRLLSVFFHNKGVVLSRTKLLEEIWDAAGEFVNDNTLTVYIKRLREKIEEDAGNPLIIKTVRGIGYKAGE